MGKSGNSTDPYIQTVNLSKKYPGARTLALHDLSISVMPGEVYGFLGPNGAGKTTAIKLLMNFLRPSEGRAILLGSDAHSEPVTIKNKVGYLAGDIPLYPKMTGYQFLKYMGELQPATDKSYRDNLVKKLKFDPAKKLGQLSRGNRQKAAIIQAFMHKPDVLILDEPTSGLDPLMQEVFFDLVLDAKKRGAAVFVSSHIMSEVQKMCDRVGIIRDGQLVGEYSIKELAAENAQTFDITFEGTGPTKRELKSVPGLQLESYSKQSITVHLNERISPLLALISKYEVAKIDAKNLDLEDTFLRFYGDAKEQKNK